MAVDAAAGTLSTKLGGALGGATAGFQLVQGAMGAFGSESAKVEEALLKVQSAMAVSQGLQSIGESIDSFKQLGAVLKNTSVVQKVLTTTTAAYTFVTEASTAGLKLFRLALIGTGIGAIVVGLGLLIANFDKVKNAVMNVIPGLKSVGEFFGGIVDSITDFVGATSDASRALDKLKKDADNTLSVNKKFMQEHSDQVDEYTKKKIEAKNTYAEAIKEDGANQLELAKKLSRELAAIEFSRGDEKRKIQKDANEKAIADRKAAGEKTKKDAEDEAKRLKDEKAKEAEDFFANAKEKSNKYEADLKIQQENQLALLQEGIDAEQVIENNASANKKIEDEKEIEFQKNKDLAIATSKQNLTNIISGLEASGLNKTKAGQVISKAIALTQIGIDSAVAISKASTLANAEGVAAQLAFPNVPGIGTIARVVSYASTAASVIGNISRARQLLSSGGSGGGGSAPSGGGGAPAAPAFNVVGASSTNQLAQTIGNQQQQPIKAYVVANDVTTQQGLDRNIVQAASIG